MVYDVFGAGNSIVDVLVRVDDNLLYDLKLPKGVMSLVDEKRSKELLKTVEFSQQSIMPGGSCCNTMIGLRNLGGSCVYAGAVGDDAFGAMYTEKIRNMGVEGNVVPIKGATGSSIIFVTPDSERTMNTHLGVCPRFGKEHIDVEKLMQSKVFHTTGYFVDTAPEAVLNALGVAKRNGLIVSFDLSDPFLIKEKRGRMLRVVKDYADIVFMNRDEANLFQGEFENHTLQQIARYAKTVVVKVGSRGSFVCHRKRFYRIPPFRVTAVDTTGAGDMYAAGFLYGITHGYKPKDAAHIGSYAASKVVEVIGARVEYPLKRMVKERFG